MHTPVQSGEAAHHRKAAFRPEIQGLRALAVLSVVLFHAKVPGFGAGYLGVDIFFVISGYLISRNIVGDLDKGRFSIAEFYVRRARRILPALLATVLLTLVAGLLWLPPEALSELAAEALASMAFVSNVYFWLSAHQYFAPDSDNLLLLHLWSLAVEEQFYVFWPLVLFWSARIGRAALVAALLGLVAFVAAQTYDGHDPSAVFYLTPFRVFQFALGALVCLLERRYEVLPFRRVLFGVGLFLCLGSIVNLTMFARLSGLSSALGAALVIYGGNSGVLSRLLSNRPAVAIGEISYSVYLVHWPVVVLLTYVLGSPMSAATQAVAVALALVLGAAMYALVERPFRASGRIASTARALTIIAATAGTVVSLSTAIWFGHGWQWRLTPEQQEWDRLVQAGAGPCEVRRDACDFGDPVGQDRLLVVGDSYAEHYIGGLDAYAKAGNLRGIAYISGGCLVLSGILRVGWEDERCRRDRDRILAEVAGSDAPLLISQAWHGYPNGSIGDDSGRPIEISSETQRLSILQKALEDTIRMLDNGRRRFVIVGQQVLAGCDLAINRLSPAPLGHAGGAPCPALPRTEIGKQTSEIDGMLAEVAANYPGRVLLLRPEDVMCNQETCPFDRNGISYYRDRGHLSLGGSEFFVNAVADQLHAFLAGPTTE